jgi:hypothetical protein
MSMRLANIRGSARTRELPVRWSPFWPLVFWSDYLFSLAKITENGDRSVGVCGAARLVALLGQGWGMAR